MPLIIIRGAGDIASGIALRLHRSGYSIIMTDLPAPTSIRRTVCFSEAVYRGETKVEEVHARLAANAADALRLLEENILPVIVDPSHATGVARYVKPMAMAAAACGADGLIIEVHNDPPHALCDGAQSLRPEQFDDLVRAVRRVRAAVQDEN